MNNDDQISGSKRASQVEGLGCAVTLAGINLVSMALLALTFAVGPYSSKAQEAWYRGGSIAFLCLGAIFPIALLLLTARRHRAVTKIVTVWMGVALLAFISYVFLSGGGD